MALPENKPNDRVYLCLNMWDVSAATSVLGGQAWAISPVRGYVKNARGVLHGAITVGDANISMKIVTTAVTGMAAVVANSGSAAGDQYTMTPTSLSTSFVNAGDNLNIISDGGSTTTAAMTWVIEIDVV